MLKFRTQGFSGYSVGYSPFFDSKIAVAAAANFGLVGNGRLYILDIQATGTIVSQAVFDTQDGLFSLAWSELNENQIATANGDGSIKLFDLTRPNFPIAVMKEHAQEVFGLNWNLQDKATFCSGSWDGTIKVWTPGRNQSLLTLNAAALMPNTRVQQQLPQHSQHQQPPHIKGVPASHGDSPTNCIFSVKWSPHDPTIIASTHSDSAFRLWDTRQPSGMPVLTMPDAHLGGDCLSVDWNKYRPTVLATAGVDRAIKVWDTRNTRSAINEFRGHEFAVRSAKWSPHSPDVLLSTSYDMTARVWQDATGSSSPQPAFNPRAGQSKGLSKVFDAHREFVIDCDWSLWGQPGWVATTGWDEMVYIWHTG